MSETLETRAPMVLKPIATVRNDVTETGRRDWAHVVSEIVVEPAYVEALDGLDDFSHIVVLFWMHRSPTGRDVPNKTHPQMRPDLPLVGVFATRSPVRPNPLGMTVAKLLERRANVIRVMGLDAVDGTPVVDIKPYLPDEAAADARVPDWIRKLRQSSSV